MGWRMKNQRQPNYSWANGPVNIGISAQIACREAATDLFGRDSPLYWGNLSF